MDGILHFDSTVILAYPVPLFWNPNEVLTKAFRAGTDLWRKPSQDTNTAPVLYTRPCGGYGFNHAEVLVGFANVSAMDRRVGLLEWDQGGLVIFAGQKWVKAGIEYRDGGCVASSVSAGTDGADWSLIELPSGQYDLRVRFERMGDSLWVWFEDGMGDWKKLREINWFFWGVEEKNNSLRVGVYASRPVDLPFERGRQQDNLVVEFEGLEIY